MNERTRFVWLDVHKATIAVAVAVAGSFGDPEDHGQIANDPGAVRKLLTRLGDGGARLSVAYEAGGPTGNERKFCCPQSLQFSCASSSNPSALPFSA